MSNCKRRARGARTRVRTTSSSKRGNIDVFTWVLLGERVVELYNAYLVDEEKHIWLVIQLANPRSKCLIYYRSTLEVNVFHWK
jgi:hypothetical protein